MIRKTAVASMLFALFALAAAPTAAEEPAAKIEPYVASFAFTPRAERAPNSLGVTAAVAKTSFFPCRVPGPDDTWSYQLNILGKIDPSTGEMLWFAFPQFQNLPTKLRKDVAEILFAKGLRVRGPYESYDAIPAADKNSIDLYFVPQMKLTLTQRANKLNREAETIDTYIEVDGTVTLEARNMATREALWTGTASLEKISFTSRMPSAGYKVGDRFNSIMNEVAKGIERQYHTLMGNISDSIVPQEMMALKKSGAIGKGKTGY